MKIEIDSLDYGDQGPYEVDSFSTLADRYMDYFKRRAKEAYRIQNRWDSQQGKDYGPVHASSYIEGYVAATRWDFISHLKEV